METEKNAYWGFVLSLIIAGVLLFPNLGKFGMWEPGETLRAETAEAYLDGSYKTQPELSKANLEERLVAFSWSLMGRSAFSGRLPIALLGLLAVAALFLIARELVGSSTATICAVALASSPVFLFHSKQLTSGMPPMFSEILALGGLSLLAYTQDKRSRVMGYCFAALGIVAGWLSAGLLMGVAAPFASIFLALALDGKLAAIFRKEAPGVAKSTERLIFVAGSVAVAAGMAFVAGSLFPEDAGPLFTFGLPSNTGSADSFDFVLEQIAYGWFPWSTLIPLIGIGLFSAQDSVLDEQKRPLVHLIIASLSVGYICQTVQIHFYGITPFFHALPILLAAALVIARFEEQTVPWRLAALFGIVAFILVVRDFAQKPEVILMGHALQKSTMPKGFMPIYKAAVCSVIFGVMLVALGFFGARDKGNQKWKGWRSRIFVPLVALSFGGYIAFSLVPELSLHWSSKHAVDSYKKFKQGDEKLAVYGPGPFQSGAKKLNTAEEVVDWLSDDARNFLLFPKAKLAEINRTYREKNKRNVFVLDAESTRLLLATSRPTTGEKNANPIDKFVRSSQFSPGPSHKVDINFDNKLRLIGYDVKNAKGEETLLKGGEFTLSTFWEVVDALPRNYDIFIHFDGPGGRFHGDHKPLDNAYPTRHWRPGDYVKDTYRRAVPVYQKAGTYRINIGMYEKSSSLRLPILDEPKAEKNAYHLTSVTLK